MTLEASNQSNTDAAPYEQPQAKPVPKKRVEIAEPPSEPTEPAESTPTVVMNPITENVPSKLEELMNTCKDNKLMSLLVVVAAGTLVYYIVDSYVLTKK